MEGEFADGGVFLVKLLDVHSILYIFGRVVSGSTFVFTIRNKRGVRIMATREVEKSCSTREMSSS